MNKILKTGLLLQIPNALLLVGIILVSLALAIDWLAILNNLAIIAAISIIGLINIFSIIFIIVGLTTKDDNTNNRI